MFIVADKLSMLVAMGVLDPPDTWYKANVLRRQHSQRIRGTKTILDSGADATSYPNYVIERLDQPPPSREPNPNLGLAVESKTDQP
jgi:hypothetical protein